MDGFERRKERKKENIQRAAFELLSKYGLQKVTIAEIAEKASVSQVSIYNYYGSKDQLVLEVVKTFMDQTIKKYMDIMDEDLTFLEKLEKILEQELQIVESLSENLISSLMDSNHEIQAFFDTFMKEKTVPFLMRFIQEGKEAGFIHTKLSDDMIMLYIGMYYRELMQHPEWYSSEEKKMRVTKEILQLFFYGLMGKQ